MTEIDSPADNSESWAEVEGGRTCPMGSPACDAPPARRKWGIRASCCWGLSPPRVSTLLGMFAGGKAIDTVLMVRPKALLVMIATPRSLPRTGATGNV